jgi:hypothetical protein
MESADRSLDDSEYDLAPQEKTADFEAAVTDFYAKLLANQEPLGKEFERVLHENLWDLYVRS